VSSARRLLVVSDDAVARAGLRALAEAAGLAVVAEAASEGLGDAADEDADAVLWDLGRTGVVDTSKPLKAFLESEGLTQMRATQGAEEASGYVVAWEHYAVVCGITDLGKVVEEVRALSD
jgi:DNA-binding NarL/FixJ family response regulator